MIFLFLAKGKEPRTLLHLGDQATSPPPVQEERGGSRSRRLRPHVVARRCGRTGSEKRRSGEGRLAVAFVFFQRVNLKSFEINNPVSSFPSVSTPPERRRGATFSRRTRSSALSQHWCQQQGVRLAAAESRPRHLRSRYMSYIIIMSYIYIPIMNNKSNCNAKNKRADPHQGRAILYALIFKKNMTQKFFISLLWRILQESRYP